MVSLYVYGDYFNMLTILFICHGKLIETHKFLAP
jgi:hypothetical protein